MWQSQSHKPKKWWYIPHFQRHHTYNSCWFHIPSSAPVIQRHLPIFGDSPLCLNYTHYSFPPINGYEFRCFKIPIQSPSFAWSTPHLKKVASPWPRYYWAAACGGEEGIVQLVQQLTAELKLCMQQLGVSQLRQLNPRRGWGPGGMVFGLGNSKGLGEEDSDDQL